MRLCLWALVIAFILLIPLVLTIQDGGMEGVGWNWSPSDFIIMGAVLFSIGLAYELIAKRSDNTIFRLAFGVGLGAALLLFWVNGAVGLIGDSDVNMLYGAVFIVGLMGSLLSRFKPIGMTRTLFAAALVQILVPTIALIIWPPPAISWSPGVWQVFFLNAGFAMLFVLSALLFQKAEGRRSD